MVDAAWNVSKAQHYCFASYVILGLILAAFLPSMVRVARDMMSMWYLTEPGLEVDCGYGVYSTEARDPVEWMDEYCRPTPADIIVAIVGTQLIPVDVAGRIGELLQHDALNLSELGVEEGEVLRGCARR